MSGSRTATRELVNASYSATRSWWTPKTSIGRSAPSTTYVRSVACHVREAGPLAGRRITQLIHPTAPPPFAGGFPSSLTGFFGGARGAGRGSLPPTVTTGKRPKGSLQPCPMKSISHFWRCR